jgi:hypothetical protein
VNKRILVSLASLVLMASTSAACGGGSGDEGRIAEAIERATTTKDPSNCTELQTQRFDERNTGQNGRAAVKRCEEEAKEGGRRAKGAKVSDISVDGEKATAKVEFEGGSLGSQALEVALVEEGGKWKLDRIEGFADYDGKALGEAFERQFEKEPKGLSPAQARCIAGKIGKASQAEAETLFFGGTPDAIEELAESCA